MAEGLRDYLPVKEVIVHSKSSAGKPIDADEAEMLAARAHLIISGLGDWGACTACSLHDAIQMEAHGIPTSLIITEPFAPIVSSFAPTVGMDQYTGTVMVPHRVATTDNEGLRELAKSIVEKVNDRLTIWCGMEFFRYPYETEFGVAMTNAFEILS